MRHRLRTLLIAAGPALLVFGYFCLNYTRGTEERHVAFASRHGLPQPSRQIFFGGVIAVAAGAGAVGYLVGAGSSRGNTE